MNDIISLEAVRFAQLQIIFKKAKKYAFGIPSCKYRSQGTIKEFRSNNQKIQKKKQRSSYWVRQLEGYLINNIQVGDQECQNFPIRKSYLHERKIMPTSTLLIRRVFKQPEPILQTKILNYPSQPEQEEPYLKQIEAELLLKIVNLLIDMKKFPNQKVWVLIY
ncbi:hypothetical protein pb186bvf_019074 [Paramecium bursaria]